MSSESKVRRRDFLLSAITGKAAQTSNQYSKLGAKVVIYPGHFIRQEVLLREKLILEDKSMDIDDRMNHADTLIVTIGQPYGRGRSGKSAAWNMAHNAWEDAMAWWKDYVLQRRWYKHEIMVRVRDWVEVPEVEYLDDGTTMLKTKQVPTVRLVHQETWAARKSLDEEMRKAANRPPEWKTIEYVGLEQSMDRRMVDMMDKVGFDSATAEEAINVAGEELLTIAMIALNLAWGDEDTPQQTAEIFMQPSQQGQWGHEVEPASKINRPEGGGRTGVHQT